MPIKHTKVAIAYDFDGTLAPGNMQELSFIPALKTTNSKFWAAVKEDAQKHQADEILCYMQKMINDAKHADLSIKRQSIVDHGKDLKLFPGVESWFDRINHVGKCLGLSIEHYIISSGLEEIIEGTIISRHFEKIFASKFKYSADDVAEWPALSVNYTTKTQYLFRINKGALDIHDAEGVNKFVPQEKRPIPFSRIVYLGDGDTDVPCMRLVKDQGGHSIAVYAPNTNGARAKAKKFVDEGRVNVAVAADFSSEKKLDMIIQSLLAKIQADISLENQFK